MASGTENDSKSASLSGRNFTGRNFAKVPQNPIQRLHMRELGGLHRSHKNSVRSQIFHKLPGRLGFSLPSLVDESVLHEGHVFLGFTKDGNCVISYTLHLETDMHTAYPYYVYKLQWWRFIPYKRLKKIGEVRLFGEEEIQQDLYLAVCEWPTDDSRILIHGYCAPPQGEEKHQCYVTITATPPIAPCEDCSQLAILHAQNGYQESLCSAPPRCLNHAFTIHTKYELAPPYPSFMPQVSLKLDGIVVVNTGDSLIALSVDIEDNHSGFGFQLYSPRVTRSMSNLSTLSSSPSEDVMSADSHQTDACRSDIDTQNYSSERLLSFFTVHSPCSSGVHRGLTTPKDTTNVGGASAAELRSPASLRERRPSVGKENLQQGAMQPLGSPPPLIPSDPTTSRHTTPPASRAHRSLDIYNFDDFTPKKGDDSQDCPEADMPGNSKTSSVRATLSFSASQHGARIPTSTEEISLDKLLDSQPLEDCDDCDKTTSASLDHFEKPSSIPRSGISTSQRAFSNLSLTATPLDFSLGKAVAISPGYNKLDTGSSTCSSCVSSPIIVQSDSQCFTYSVRRYIDSYSQGRPDSPIDIEDDLNLAYHSLLPLEVHGANYGSMKLLTKQCFTPHSPCVVIKQLTLDIEHYLGEAVKNCADWGSRYMSFTDYDIEILEVCPDTAEVIVVVFVLVRARPPKDPHKHKHDVRSIPKLYKTGFMLVWDLRSGSYNTLVVADLVEVNQAQLMRKCRHPGFRVCERLRKRFAVPQSYPCSVRVLTNEAVFKGQSLKMLLDRHHCVAILL